MSRYHHDPRGGRRPTGGNQPPSGYFTDPERDQERGGNWGPPGVWIGEEGTNTWGNTNSGNRSSPGWANTQPQNQRDQPLANRPTPFVSSSSPSNTPHPPSLPPSPSTWTNPNQGGWSHQQPPTAPRGSTAMTDRIFDNAMQHTRGRRSYRGI